MAGQALQPVFQEHTASFRTSGTPNVFQGTQTQSPPQTRPRSLFLPSSLSPQHPRPRPQSSPHPIQPIQALALPSPVPLHSSPTPNFPTPLPSFLEPRSPPRLTGSAVARNSTRYSTSTRVELFLPSLLVSLPSTLAERSV